MKLALPSSVASFAAAFGVLGGLLGTSDARAATLSAHFSYTNLVSASVTSPNVTGNVSTVKFNWTRIDAPGPGVDPTLAHEFNSYCMEIAQHIQPAADYTFQVLSPVEAGWSPERTLAMQLLFADHLADVTTSDTNAAMQLAVWELVEDSDHSLETGSFRVGAPAAAKGIAQGWLTALSTADTNRTLPTLFILSSPSAQDQIAVQIPAPGAAACAMMGLAMLSGRRRR